MRLFYNETIGEETSTGGTLAALDQLPTPDDDDLERDVDLLGE